MPGGPGCGGLTCLLLGAGRLGAPHPLCGLSGGTVSVGAAPPVPWVPGNETVGWA